jgi:hypothetical protein
MPRIAGFTILIVAFAGTAALAQERAFEETVALEAGGRLSLDTSRGSVALTPWDRSEVEVRARIVPPPLVDDDCGREATDAVVIDVRLRDGGVDVRTDRDEAPRCGWLRVLGQQRALARVHYEIRAPRALEIDFDINRADTTLGGFDGRIRLDVNRSRLEADDLNGTIRIDLNRGQLEARALAGTVRIDLNRSRGDLTEVQGVLHLDANRTDVTLRGVRIDDDSRVEINRGDIDLELVDGQALTVDGRTRRSEITSDVPATEQQRSDENRYEAMINGGGPRLRIDANRSRVRLQPS